MQNFPQLPVRYGLKIPWLRVRISAGRALKERQCTLKGQAWFVNVRGSVHWKGVYRVGDIIMANWIKCISPHGEIYALDPIFLIFVDNFSILKTPSKQFAL